MALISTAFLESFIQYNGFLGLISMGIICLIVLNLIYIVIFYRNKEFKYLLNIANGIKKKLLHKNTLEINN